MNNISKEQILSAYIPIPSLEKKNEITNYIQNIREKAKELQEEALSILNKAKQEVEQIILG